MSAFHKATLLVYGAARLHPQQGWRMCSRAFGRALIKSPHIVAQHFNVAELSTGHMCWDLDEALNMAHASCLLSYGHPEYTHFFITSRRAALEVGAKWLSEDERQAAETLMAAYWEEIISSESV